MRSRHSAVAVIVAAGLSMTAGVEAADPPAPDLPRLDCTARKTDPAGDTFFRDPAVAMAKPALDIESLFFGSTAEDVLIFLKVKDVVTPQTMPTEDPAYYYKVSFKHGTTAFVVQPFQINPQHAAALGSPKSPETTPVGTTATATMDATTDLITMKLPRASMEAKSAGTPVVDGGMLTDISVTTYRYFGAGANSMITADTMAPTGDAAKWTVGDNYCLGPAPAVLSEVTAKAAQFGDVSTLSAKLLDEKGQPLANEQVTFTVAGSPGAPLTGTTDAAGVASVPYTVVAPAGAREVKVAFAGTATAGKAVATGTLAVTPEVTKFLALAVKKTSTTGRAVTATLRDDDGKAVAAQKVGWYVNNKLVATLTTDSAGRTVFKTAKAGQVVQARFAGVTGKYVAAKSSAPKV